MLPTFLIIGSQKAGTTTIYNVFKKHPQIFLSEEKEANFFFLDHIYKKGIDHYKKFFKNAKYHFDAIGEASPGYICHPFAPLRIKKYLPDVKLILTVRNPIERAYSQYWDSRRKLEESLTFKETLFIALSDNYEPGKRGYFSRGIYIRYIERYLKYFGRKQLLILVFDDMIDNPLSVYKMCFRFLNVDDSFECAEMRQKFNPMTIWNNPIYKLFFYKPKYSAYLPHFIKKPLFFGHKIPYDYPSMDDMSKARLKEFYSVPNKQLSNFIKRDLSHWNR